MAGEWELNRRFVDDYCASLATCLIANRLSIHPLRIRPVLRPSSYITRSEPAGVESLSQSVPQHFVIQFILEANDAVRIEHIESIGETVVESIDIVILDVPEEVASQP